MPTPEETMDAAIDELIDNGNSVEVRVTGIATKNAITVSGAYKEAEVGTLQHSIQVTTTSVGLIKAISNAIVATGLP